MALGRQSDLAPVLFSCIATLIPCVMNSWWQVAPLLVVWALGASVRLVYGDRQLKTDAAVFGVATALFATKELAFVLVTAAEQLGKVAGSWWHDGRFMVPVILASMFFLWVIYPRPRIPQELPRGLTRWTSQHPSPKIFPCSTKHARMFPKRHSFEYSYLQCGFPIIPAGITSEGEAVGGSHDREIGRWWLQIRAEDYLTRGNGDLGFYGKLKLFLRQQHVRDHEWDYAYLVTAPRFFGYAFNPVSFWYIYDTDQQLTKMILEVNNTFGERRMYLLDGSSMPSPPSTPESEASGPPLPEGVKARFTDLWMKDFHVSPFNSRKGSYALKALNPFPYATYDKPAIDNTITLKSSKDHAKLVARINSTGKALDPEHMGIWDSLKFVFSWWWVGLVTMPRILREAFKIFFKRKLHVWFRPEVLYTSVGRTPTSTEIELYHIFKDYLAYLVNQSQDAFCITLHSAIPNEPVQRIETDHRPGEQGITRDFEIHILTPAFYSRFVHYAYTSEAFDRECIFTDEKNRTLWISRPELLVALMSRLRFSERCIEDTAERSYLDKMRWNILRKLRCPPAAPAYPISTPSKQDFISEDVRALPLSELDCFVRNFASQAHAGSYRRIVTKIFLAQRLFLGFAEVIGILDSVFRVLLCGLGAWQFRSWSMREPDVDPLRCLWNNAESNQLGSCFTRGAVRAEWLWLIGTTLSVSACHVYGMIKGYN